MNWSSVIAAGLNDGSEKSHRISSRENTGQSWHRRLFFCHRLITLSALASLGSNRKVDLRRIPPRKDSLITTMEGTFKMLKGWSAWNKIRLFLKSLLSTYGITSTDLVAEAFLGCYLDRVVLSQLQRLQPRRHSLKVGVLRF